MSKAPFQIIAEGGILMIPILFCSLLALSITIERFFCLRRAKIDTQDFMGAIRAVLDKGNIKEAVNICEEAGGPIGRILRAGILRHNQSRREIREAIDEAGQLEIPRLERYLGALSTIANVAPLLGLLGTVSGMIKAFGVITEHAGSGPVSPALLADGIGNALVTTAAGLVVAIPTLIFYNYFVSKIDNMILEMEVTSSELLDLLTDNERTGMSGDAL